jgi:hypothetical protein
MVPVPSNQLISFLDWLNQRGVTISAQQPDFERLTALASEFVAACGLKHRNLLLAEIMAAFQMCPRPEEQSVEGQMNHFVQCAMCVFFTSGGISRLRTREWPASELEQVHVEKQEDDYWFTIEPGMHPLLGGFVDSANGARLESKLRTALESKLRTEHPRSYESTLLDLIRASESELCEEFSRYLAEEGEEGEEGRLTRTYRIWKRQLIDRSFLRRLLDQDAQPSDKGPERHGVPLERNESREDAARRLAESVQAAIVEGAYDHLIANQDSPLAALLDRIIVGPENLAQAIEFIDWLRQHEPELIVPGSIPAQELERLALQFCEDNGYSNGRTFSHQARRWLSGSGSDTVIRRIAGLLGLHPRPRLPDGHPEPKNPLDRYGSVRFHGLFLFLQSGDFPSFISNNWRDLHHLTGDDLDIYFSQNDLTDRTSGHAIRDQFRSLRLRVDALPALLIWEDELEAGTTISLQELSHSQIIEVMQSVVQAIQEGGTLSDITSRGTDHASGLRQERSGSRIGSLIIDGGQVRIAAWGDVVMKDKVMRDKYENKGIAGAMGPGSNVHDSVFVQGAGSSEIVITREGAVVISELATLLATHEIELVKQAERLKGAAYLAALADAATEGREQGDSLANWRTWLKDLGNRASAVIQFLANATTIAAPIAKLLGFPL